MPKAVLVLVAYSTWGYCELTRMTPVFVLERRLQVVHAMSSEAVRLAGLLQYCINETGYDIMRYSNISSV